MTVLQMRTFIKGKDNREKIKEENERRRGGIREQGQGEEGRIKECVCSPQVPYFYA